MRLIDGDSLKRKAQKVATESWKMKIRAYVETVLNQFIDWIDAAPTIEERKMGKWIITCEFEDCYYAKCNQCNITQVFYFNKQLTNFCPHCGADMRGEGEE